MIIGPLSIDPDRRFESLKISSASPTPTGVRVGSIGGGTKALCTATVAKITSKEPNGHTYLKSAKKSIPEYKFADYDATRLTNAHPTMHVATPAALTSSALAENHDPIINPMVAVVIPNNTGLGSLSAGLIRNPGPPNNPLKHASTPDTSVGRSESPLSSTSPYLLTRKEPPT